MRETNLHSFMQSCLVNLKTMTVGFCAVDKKWVSFTYFLACLLLSKSTKVVNSKREFSGFFQKRTGNLSPSKREFSEAQFQTNSLFRRLRLRCAIVAFILACKASCFQTFDFRSRSSADLGRLWLLQEKSFAVSDSVGTAAYLVLVLSMFKLTE